MAFFFYYTVLATYSFFLGLAINYYLSIQTSLNLGKQHIDQSPLIDNVNYAKAFSAGAFGGSLGCLVHKNVQKNFVLV